MPRRPASVELLAALAKVLRARKIRWYVFGAQAAIVYGSPRMTMDVDVDVRAVLGTMGSSMDLRYVRDLLGQLDEAEDRAELLPTLERLLKETDGEA